MMIAAWIGVLLLLTWLFEGEIARQFNPNPDPAGRVGEDGAVEVVLQRNAQGHYVAGGSINGRPVAFLLDTGATDVAVPASLAEKLRLPRLGSGFSRTANGVVQTWRSRLDRVALGPIELRDVRAAVLPGMAGDDHVLLGMSFLKRLELVQRGDTLTLRQFPH
ncbi:MAG: TIGR02281 family clan AA aspartic protease [Gammaproteobacteria bacterium]